MNEDLREAFAVLDRHIESHRALSLCDAYSAQELPRLEAARETFAALAASPAAPAQPEGGDAVDAPPIPAWLIDACQSRVWAAAWEMSAKIARPAPAQQAVTVDDAMAERAREAYFCAADAKEAFTDRVAMRAALTAALHQQAAGSASCEATVAEVPCSTHPDAPHGFNRNGSHNAGRYVCDCEGWTPSDAGSAPGEACNHERSYGAPWRCAKCGLRMDEATTTPAVSVAAPVGVDEIEQAAIESAKDAARYRWLRAEHMSYGRSWHIREPSNSVAPINIDAAIDAALSLASTKERAE